MSIILSQNKNNLSKVIEIFKKGGLVIFPTDTVYGIGCVLDKKAILKLYKIKNRSLNKPTAILLNKDLYNKKLAKQNYLINVPKEALKSFLLGKTTIIFPKTYFNLEIPKILVKNKTIGIRLPNDSWLEKLINLVGPIAASSANFAGKSTPKSFKDLDKKILEKVDLVIKTRKEMLGKSSKVFDLESLKYLR